MSLKMIREAQIRTTTSPEELKLLEAAKDALGKDSIVAIVEAFTPTADDYAKWLEVIVGYAQDAGLSVSKRADFNEIAHAVLENDPANPPFNLRPHIVNKLWADMKASKHQSKINDAVRAQEEEEQLGDAIRAMTGEVRDVDDHEFALDKDHLDDLDQAGDTDNQIAHAHIDDEGCCSNCGAHVDNAPEEDDSCTMCDAILHKGDEHHVNGDDEGDEQLHDRIGGAEELGTFGGKPNNSRNLDMPGNEENEENSSSAYQLGHKHGFSGQLSQIAKMKPVDEFAYRDGYRHGVEDRNEADKRKKQEENEEHVGNSHSSFQQGLMDGYKGRSMRVGAMANADYHRGYAAGVKDRKKHEQSMNPAKFPHDTEEEQQSNPNYPSKPFDYDEWMASRNRTGAENEEASPMTAKMGQEVNPDRKPKSLLQHVLTGPKDVVNKALKDVEADGENAWKKHELPKNPHPKQSLAYRSWERGLKKAMKSHLGLDEKPVATSKHKSKKR